MQKKKRVTDLSALRQKDKEITVFIWVFAAGWLCGGVIGNAPLRVAGKTGFFFFILLSIVISTGMRKLRQQEEQNGKNS